MNLLPRTIIACAGASVAVYGFAVGSPVASTLIGGSAFAFAVFINVIEPFWHRWSEGRNARKKPHEEINGTGAIYAKCLELIRSATKEVRYMVPTPSPGSYSAGNHIFEEMLHEIEQKTASGVDVRIICDIFDWRKVPYALALRARGASVRTFENTQYRYFLIVDDQELLTMYTVATKEPKRIKDLNVTVRQLSNRADLTRNAEQVQHKIAEFDEEWRSRSASSVDHHVLKLTTVACPHCSQSVTINLMADDLTLEGAGA